MREPSGPAASGPSAYVHEAELELFEGTDPQAPGGAVTVALCGHWDHDGPCRWPHHSAIAGGAQPRLLRTVFAARPQDEPEIRALIDGALRADTRWSVRCSGASRLRKEEEPLGRDLVADSA
jgi:hypothetical protein